MQVTESFIYPRSSGYAKDVERKEIEMLRLARVDILRMLVNVYQENAPWITAVRLGKVLVLEFPNRKFTGRITGTASSVAVTSRTMLTEVQVSNSDLVLPSGVKHVDFSKVQTVNRSNGKGSSPKQ
jgi:multidrug efflux pump subunit AcrA (membrane-fusion protein)